MFLQDSFKKEDLDSTCDSDSDDQILVKMPLPKKEEIVDLINSD